MHNYYLMEPFTMFVSLNLSKSFNPDTQPYKYQINVLLSQIRFQITPDLMHDLVRMKAFFEMFSYIVDLKKYKPLFKPSYFLRKDVIEKYGKERVAKMKRLNIRDWLWLSVWYVRLKKISRGITPYSILRIEEAVRKEDFSNPVEKVRAARLEDYKPYHGEVKTILGRAKEDLNEILEDFNIDIDSDLKNIK